VLPLLTTRVARELFGLDRPFVWSDAEVRPTRINQFHHLMTRVDPKQLVALFDVEPAPGAAPPATSRGSAAAMPPRAVPSDTAALAAAAAVEGNLISIDDFLRIDLRVAKVLNADLVAGADKLLKLRVDVGELGEREIFAGIRAAYDHASLVGRLIVVVANLEPRKMRFGTSEGMMLAAGPGGKDIFVLSPDTGATPGMRVK
jgi:methionyl-tRNA synthetase